MSAAEKDNVCKRALSLIGEPPASPFTGGTTLRDIECVTHYTSALQDVLTHHRWDFATRMHELELATEPSVVPPHLPHAYTLPTNSLRFHEVILTDGRTLDHFRIIDELLFTDNAELEGVLFYTVNTAEPEDMPPMVVECLVYALAQRLAASTTQNPNLTEQMRAYLASAYSRAITTDSRQTGSNDYVSIPALLSQTGIYQSRFFRRV